MKKYNKKGENHEKCPESSITKINLLSKDRLSTSDSGLMKMWGAADDNTNKLREEDLEYFLKGPGKLKRATFVMNSRAKLQTKPAPSSDYHKTDKTRTK